ncbi:hypothetical protein TNCV_2201471 [Trichonephila clavipes]|nr:hypothetical protein TNCV_2201471 [Trichonephila clavipes]
MKEKNSERRNSSRPRNRSRNRSFFVQGILLLVSQKSFKNELRNAFHPAAIKKKTNQRVNATTFAATYFTSPFIKDKSSNTAFSSIPDLTSAFSPASLSGEKERATVLATVSR